MEDSKMLGHAELQCPNPLHVKTRSMKGGEDALMEKPKINRNLSLLPSPLKLITSKPLSDRRGVACH